MSRYLLPLPALLLTALLCSGAPDKAEDNCLLLTARSREKVEATGTLYRELEKPLRWEPKQTAIVICDMWDQHWCKCATERVAEMAPRMNAVVKAARAKGVFII